MRALVMRPPTDDEMVEHPEPPSAGRSQLASTEEVRASYKVALERWNETQAPFRWDPKGQFRLRCFISLVVFLLRDTLSRSRVHQWKKPQEVGQRLNEMSLKGEWGEMGRLVSDEMPDTFAVVGEYDEVAWKVKERFGDVLDEVSFRMDVSSSSDQEALKKIIEALKS